MKGKDGGKKREILGSVSRKCTAMTNSGIRGGEEERKRGIERGIERGVEKRRVMRGISSWI